MKNVTAFLRGCVATTILAPSVLFVNVLQTIVFPMGFLVPSLTRKFNIFLCHCWFRLLSFSLRKVIRLPVSFSGDALPVKGNALLFCNHQSMSDIPLLVIAATAAGRAGDMKWFVKDVLKWVPGIGWGLYFLDCLFVKRNWTSDRDKILSTFERLKNFKNPFWIVSFLEGTRARPHNLERSREFARKRGLPVLQNVLLPRTKGFTATLEGLESDIEWIFDMTIVYPRGRPPRLLHLFFSPLKPMHVHASVFAKAKLPPGEDARSEWAIQRFVEKDQYIENFPRS